MKKLMIALATVATAFGLYADVVVPNGTSFESFSPSVGTPQTVTKTELDAAETSEATGASWTVPADVTATAVSYNGDHYSGACGSPAQWASKTINNYFSVKGSFANAVARTIGEGGVEFGDDGLYVDTLVKFTTADEDVVLADDNAKIAVWTMECTNNLGVVTGTNLMVTAGKYTGTTLDDGAVVYNAGKINDDPEGWHRLTIKAVKVNGTSSTIRGFVVYLDGVAVVCAEAGAAFGSVTLDDNAKAFYDECKLFPALSTFTSLETLAMAGQGSVDEISFTQAAPSFAQDREFATITWPNSVTEVMTNGTSIGALPAGGSFKMEWKGSDIVVAWKANDSYMDGSATITSESSKTLNIADELVAAVAKFTAGSYVGKVSSFDDMIEKAKISTEATAVTLVKDAERQLSFSNDNEQDITLDIGTNNVTYVNAENDAISGISALDGTTGVITGSVYFDGTISGTITFNGAVLGEGEISGGKFLASANELDSLKTRAPANMKFINNGATPAYYVLANAAKVTAITPAESTVALVAVDDKFAKDEVINFTVTPNANYAVTAVKVNDKNATAGTGYAYTYTVDADDITAGTLAIVVTTEASVTPITTIAITLAATEGTYGKIEALPAITSVTFDDKAVVETTDYTCAWDKALGDVGTYTVTVTPTAKYSYSGSDNKATFTLKADAEATVVLTLDPAGQIVEWTSAQFPTVTAKINDNDVTSAGELVWTDDATSAGVSVPVQPAAGTTNSYTATFVVKSGNYTGSNNTISWKVYTASVPVIDPANPTAPVEVTADSPAAAEELVKVARPSNIGDSIVSANDYDAYFTKTATLKAGTEKTYEVTAKLSDAVVQAVPETAQVAQKIVASDFTGNVTLTADKVKPGLYYALKQGETVGNRTETARALATTEGVTIQGTKWTNSGFYQIKIYTTAE